MIQKIASFFLLAFLCSFSSCGPDLDPKVDTAYKNVMAVHDEVMPEMGTIHRLRKKLRAKIKAGIADEGQKTALLNMIQTLDNADEGMMSWMADFDMPKKASIDQQLEYLKKEQVKIDKVSVDMKSAIAKAKDMVEE